MISDDISNLFFKVFHFELPTSSKLLYLFLQTIIPDFVVSYLGVAAKINNFLFEYNGF